METTFKITTTAYNAMLKTIASKPAEQGGVLIGKDGIITDFIYDKEAITTSVTYTLNIGYLNPKIKAFRQEGKELVGIVHSHPGLPRLSQPDKDYFNSQFENFDREFFYTPIILSAKDGTFDFLPYLFYKDGTIVKAKLEIVPDDYVLYVSKKATPKKKRKKAKQPTKTRVIIHQPLVVQTSKSNETDNRFYMTQQQAFYMLLALGCMTAFGLYFMTYYYFKSLLLILTH